MQSLIHVLTSTVEIMTLISNYTPYLYIGVMIYPSLISIRVQLISGARELKHNNPKSAKITKCIC